MDLPWLGVCVCVWCGVKRKRKWVFSYVMQRLVPIPTGGRGHWPSVPQYILFLEDMYKNDSPDIHFNSCNKKLILTRVMKELKWIFENGYGRVSWQ